jgi:hypothetical protein
MIMKTVISIMIIQSKQSQNMGRLIKMLDTPEMGGEYGRETDRKCNGSPVYV